MFIRLVCPISFASAFSFFNLLNFNVKQGVGLFEFVPQNIGLMQAPAIESGMGSIDSAVNVSLPLATPLASVNPLQIWLVVFSLIWIVGVIALLGDRNNVTDGTLTPQEWYDALMTADYKVQ